MSVPHARRVLQTIAVTLLVIGAPAIAAYALWRDSCGCSTLRIAVFLGWIWPPVLLCAVAGAALGGLASILNRRSSRNRSSLARVASGALLGIGAFCILSLLLLKQVDSNSRVVSFFQRKPVTSAVRPLKTVVRRQVAAIRANSDITPQEIQAELQDLRYAFRDGIDGCFLVKALGPLTDDEKSVVSRYFTALATEFLKSDNSEMSSRAMNAVWSVDPPATIARFERRTVEFQYLSGPDVRRFDDAAQKVQEARALGQLYSQQFPNHPHEFTKAAFKLVDAMLAQKELMDQVMKVLQTRTDLDGQLDSPKVMTQIGLDSNERAEVYHFAQAHGNPEVLTASDQVAINTISGTTIYQFGMLRSLARLAPTDVIAEATNTNDYDKELRKRVQRVFTGSVLESVRRLSREQIAFLYCLGAGKVYGIASAQPPTVWPDLSPVEANVLLDLGEESERAKKQLDLVRFSAGNDPRTFSVSLEGFRRAEWLHRRFEFLYREQRVAEVVAQILQNSPTARIAIVFGGGHNFKQAMERIRKRVPPFSLTRVSWFHQDWYRELVSVPDALADSATQVRFVINQPLFFPFQLSFLSDPTALDVAISRLKQDGGDLAQVVAESRVRLEIDHPEDPELIRQAGAMLDRQLSKAGSSDSPNK